MKSQLLIFSLIAVVMTTFSAQAQKASDKKENMMLEQRYQSCIKDRDCPAQEQWKLMGEMHERMMQSFRNMDRNCHNMDYRDCFGVQDKQDREQWHKMHSHMYDMMRHMEIWPAQRR